MVYLYAYTNFKEGLESLRRVAALYNELTKNGIECEILVNDYRAQLLARDWGLPLATTIETIKDIDAVASSEDIVIIDSKEPLEGKVLNYGEYFKKLIYINSSCDKVEFGGAVIFNLFKDGTIFNKIEESKKEDKTIFIYCDSDYEKKLLEFTDEFKSLNMDLYWGVYFFVKYEDILKEYFKDIIDSSEYFEILKEYKNILTASSQVAVDAFANGCSVNFINLRGEDECIVENLRKIGIKVINSFKEVNFNEKIKKNEQKFQFIDKFLLYVK